MVFSKFVNWLATALEYEPQAVLHIDAHGEYPQEVVGESHYQRNIGLLFKAWTEEGGKNPLVAELHYENDNEHDSKAIMVTVRGLKVGYLSRDDARAYRRRLQKAGFGEVCMSCNARIFGGPARGTMYGVWLNLPIDEL